MAFLSDVHGNRVALEAVLADARQVGATQWWVLGDLVAIGPEPVETLELLADLPDVHFLRGNTDRYVVTGDRPTPHAADVERDPSPASVFAEVEASFAWTRRVLESAGWLSWLSELPAVQRAVLPDGTRMLGVHASPASDDGPGITPTISDAELIRMLTGAAADLVVGGHTHLATDRWVSQIRAVNLGSVSNPITDDLRASYAIVDADGDGHRLAHRRVAYDHAEAVRRALRSQHPAADYIAAFQTGGQVRHPSTGTGSPTFE